MRHTRKIIFGLIIGLLPALAGAQDYDDVYFTKADRKAIQAKRQEQRAAEAAYAQRSRTNTSNKFANPEYSGTTANNAQGYEYFDEVELSRYNNAALAQTGWNNGFNSAFGWGMGVGSGFGSPFWGNNWRHRSMLWNVWGGWGSPIGFYDPFWGGRNFYNPYRFGGFANPFFCPPVVMVDNRLQPRRQVVNAARNSRGSNTRTITEGNRNTRRSSSYRNSGGRSSEPNRSWRRSNSGSRSNGNSNSTYTPRRRSSGSGGMRSGGSSGGSRRSSGGSRSSGGRRGG